MPKLTAPIVGMHFRPPAKALIQVLPAGCPLRLQREEDNPYDPKAVAVWVSPKHIPASQYTLLELNLTGMGADLAEVLAADEHHLGYLADSDGKVLAKTNAARAQVGLPPLAGNAQAHGVAEGTFALSASGEPICQFEAPQGGAE